MPRISLIFTESLLKFAFFRVFREIRVQKNKASDLRNNLLAGFASFAVQLKT